MAKTLNYTGDALKSKSTFTTSDGIKESLDAYLASDDLIQAVNLAIQLKRPLLLMGEPGCGKTRLAEAVAYELHGKEIDKHFFRWNIKSTTKAKDGIYRYDALKRLYHSNLKEGEDREKVNDINNYIEYGELGNAFTEKQNGNFPNVLLIDEIDKANIDFPNDLLLELDNKVFTIPELGKEGNKKATSDVIIFVTSNQEKELPPAFLRRCLYHFIDFPSEEKLKKIVSKYIENVDDAAIDKAIEIFTKLRENLSETDKKPSTSELIDWFKMIDFYTQLKEDKPNSSDRSSVENNLIQQLDLLDKDKIPYKQILLKTQGVIQKVLNED